VVTIVTELNEFKQLDLGRLGRLMRRPIVVDGRKLYDPRRMARLGFTYLSVGRRTPSARVLAYA
jgi:UDPglucose 6-dehydrogenase